MATAYKCDRCGKYGDGPAPYSVSRCQYYGHNGVDYTSKLSKYLCSDCYKLHELFLNNELHIQEEQKKMKIKECLVISAMATVAIMTAYKLGRKDGFGVCLTKLFEDNPELKSVDFKLDDCTITMKK